MINTVVKLRADDFMIEKIVIRTEGSSAIDKPLNPAFNITTFRSVSARNKKKMP
jgi:hypothetical protein